MRHPKFWLLMQNIKWVLQYYVEKVKNDSSESRSKRNWQHIIVFNVRVFRRIRHAICKQKVRALNSFYNNTSVTIPLSCLCENIVYTAFVTSVLLFYCAYNLIMSKNCDKAKVFQFFISTIILKERTPYKFYIQMYTWQLVH